MDSDIDDFYDGQYEEREAYLKRLEADMLGEMDELEWDYDDES